MPAREVRPGDRVGVRGHLGRRSLGHDLPAALPGAGADVDQPIGGAHHRFVVLDDQHGVALLLQLAQRLDQPRVVARMQADRRLVENVEHADQPRADAGRQPHALHLAAAERVGRAIEREVLEPHVFQKLEPPHDLRGQRLADRLLRRRKPQLREELQRLVDRQRRDLVDRQAAQAGTTGPRAAAAIRRTPSTRRARETPQACLATPRHCSPPQVHFQVSEHARETCRRRRRAVARRARSGHCSSGVSQSTFACVEQRFQQPSLLRPRVGRRASPRRHRPAGQRQAQSGSTSSGRIPRARPGRRTPGTPHRDC